MNPEYTRVTMYQVATSFKCFKEFLGQIGLLETLTDDQVLSAFQRAYKAATETPIVELTPEQDLAIQMKLWGVA